MADPTTENGLTPRQYKAIAALLATTSIRQAAIEAGVPEKTLHNWKKNPLFNRVYWEALREEWGQTKGRALTVASPMLQVLVRIAVKENARDADRISAASKVLDFATRVIELDDLEARMAAMEARFEQKL